MHQCNIDVAICPVVQFPSVLDNPELVTACNQMRQGKTGRGLRRSMWAAVEQLCGYMYTRASGGPNIDTKQSISSIAC